MQKINIAAETRIFSLVRHCGTFLGIDMVSTNTQEANEKDLSLQDTSCLVSLTV